MQEGTAGRGGPAAGRPIGGGAAVAAGGSGGMTAAGGGRSEVDFILSMSLTLSVTTLRAARRALGAGGGGLRSRRGKAGSLPRQCN